jgi:hypothetical protein
MACFCGSFEQFYLHTTFTELVPGIQQGHLLRLVNKSPSYLQYIWTQLRTLRELPQFVFMNCNEFDDDNGDHILEVLAVLAYVA